MGQPMVQATQAITITDMCLSRTTVQTSAAMACLAWGSPISVLVAMVLAIQPVLAMEWVAIQVTTTIRQLLNRTMDSIITTITKRSPYTNRRTNRPISSIPGTWDTICWEHNVDRAPELPGATGTMSLIFLSDCRSDKKI